MEKWFFFLNIMNVKTDEKKKKPKNYWKSEQQKMKKYWKNRKGGQEDKDIVLLE